VNYSKSLPKQFSDLGFFVIIEMKQKSERFSDVAE
jgi:hypothetical protein